jgi:hypothetical protein
MTRARWIIIPAAACFMIGCQAEFTKMSVRFIVPAVPQLHDQHDQQPGAADAQLTESTSSDTVSPSSTTDTGDTGAFEDIMLPQTPPFYVRIWGGPYNGFDVTFSEIQLNPGHYNFEYVDGDTNTNLRGWIQVRTTGNELIDDLNRWKNAIPERKRQLAFDVELNEDQYKSNTKAVAGLNKQLHALDRLESQLTDAIRRESVMQYRMRKRDTEYLENSVITIFPSEHMAARRTTGSALCSDDLTRANTGAPVTKVLLVTDYATTQWKIRSIQQMSRELNRCRAVFEEEIARLERREEYYTVTDHIYDYDEKFVQNEAGIQSAIAAIDQIDMQLEQLRERRLAVAFAAELLAGDTGFEPLEDDTRELQRRRVVLETKKKRLDILFDEASEKGPRRVAIERSRTRIAATIGSIDRQIDSIGEARVALQHLIDSGEVMDRQGDSRLLSANFVDDRIPTYIREAIAQDAMFTIRIQPSDKPVITFDSELAGTNAAPATAALTSDQ